MKIAAILLRASTEKQDLESQLNDLLPVVENQGYRAPEKFIIGEKITGRDNIRKEDRKSIKELKKVCEGKQVDAVFINEVSRLSRDPIAGRQYLKEFIDMQIPLYFKDVSMWTLDRETKAVIESNRQFINMLFDQAERELETLKARSIRGRKQNAREGKVTGGIIKFGYRKDRDTNRLIIDESEAEFINDIVNRYITGDYSIRALTTYANGTKTKTAYQTKSTKSTYKTKSGIIRPIDSINWTTQTIRDILTNRIYLGERTFKDIEQDIPPILTEEQHEQVKQRLKLNVKTISKAKHTHLLERLLVCGSCGSYYYGHYKKRGNSYVCSGYVRTAKICGNTTLNYEKVEGIIWDYVINETYFFKQITDEHRTELIEEQESKLKDLIKRKIEASTLKKESETKVQNLLNVVREGIFTVDEIRKDKQELDTAINSYNSTLERIDTEIKTTEKRIEYISSQSLTDKAKLHIESSRELMQEKIKEIIDNITVYKLDDSVALLQVKYLSKQINILYRYRIQQNRYYIVDDEVATFNNPHYQPDEIIQVIGKVPEFTVTSNNNNTFDDSVFGNYSGIELIKIMDKQGIFRDYIRPEKIIKK